MYFQVVYFIHVYIYSINLYGNRHMLQQKGLNCIFFSMQVVVVTW